MNSQLPRTPVHHVRNRYTGLLFGGLLLAHSLGSNADTPLHDLDNIREAARQHVLGQMGNEAAFAQAEPGRLDRRLRLTQCEQPLETFGVAGNPGGHSSVGVRCNDLPGWTLYVPVRVELRRPVYALRHAMSRGSVVHADDLVQVEVDVRRHPQGYFTDTSELVGRTLSRALAAGTVLNPSNVAQPAMIRRGQRVSLVSSLAGISVSAPGEAMADGRRGERLQVRNLSSGRVVEGTVRSATEVEIQ